MTAWVSQGWLIQYQSAQGRGICLDHHYGRDGQDAFGAVASFMALRPGAKIADMRRMINGFHERECKGGMLCYCTGKRR